MNNKPIELPLLPAEDEDPKFIIGATTLALLIGSLDIEAIKEVFGGAINRQSDKNGEEGVKAGLIATGAFFKNLNIMRELVYKEVDKMRREEKEKRAQSGDDILKTVSEE